MKNIFRKNQLMITALAVMIAIAGYLQFAESTMKEKADDELKAVDSGTVITERYVAGQDTSSLENAEDMSTILELSEEDLLALQDVNGTAKVKLDVPSLDENGAELTENYLEDGMDLVYDRPGNAGEGDDQPASASPKEGEIPGEAVFTSAGAWILSDAKLLKEQTRAKNKATLLDIIGNEYLSDDQKAQAVSSMVEMTQIAEKEAAAEILLEAKGFSDVVVSITGTGVDVVVNATALTDAQRAQIEDIVRRKTEVSPENIIISTVVKD